MPADRDRLSSPTIEGFASRDDLVAVLVSSASALGEEICFLGRSIPTGCERTIDLLGVDRTGNPILTVASIDGGEAALMEVLDLAAWIDGARSLLRQLLPGTQDAARCEGRLLFIAPNFTPRVLRIVELLARQRIELVRCRRIRLGAESGLLVENLTTGESGGSPRVDEAGPRQSASALSAGDASDPGRVGVRGEADLTQQEIEELSRPLGLSGAEGSREGASLGRSRVS